MTEHARYHCWRVAFACYTVSLCVVFAGMSVGLLTSDAADQRSPDRAPQSGNRFRDTLAQWDGQWYQKIATEGYTYDPGRMSSVAFFPLYPLLGRAVATITRLPIDIALLLVSHGLLILSFALFTRYLAAAECEVYMGGKPQRPVAPGTDSCPLAVWALALFPTAFFMYMAYSESLCLTLSLLVMWGIKQRWPLLALGLLVGLATAARPVGIALCPPLAWYAWQSSATRHVAVVRLIASIPLAISGLAIYMLFQYFAFDTPLAFVQTQDHWRYRPRLPLAEKAIVLLSLEPIWAPYVPQWPTYWAGLRSSPCILASLQAANPVLFVGAVLAVAIGWARRWLCVPEFLLAAGLLAIPYVTKAYEMNMSSHGRFVLTAFPVFLVIGRVLQRCAAAVWIAYFAVSTSFLFVYSWMWAMGYVMI